ncbi:ATP-binding cassette domain-containing protein [Agromyces mediolanus]|uniref:ABC transporter ATP-binding protein n=1 Tax=Agromyces mediolanus TaxID=41986 RepID=A0A918CKX1_AGRME|nr:ABC transporter ATP-binding protein [Agromyces mediolanus]GGR28558.1 ABC transporter ATP-binding protein [Agromyces mediolanus]GLJ72091.1 ABC transporter ATP-binding protein [Agromyces mediolanus]
MTTVIRTSDLVKRYGRTRALDGLDLEVDAGQVHGFLGPNGAGKSTTIRILLGLARASSGVASVFDAHPWRDAVALHRRIAYVPGDVSVWPNLSGGEAVDFLARLRGAAHRDPGYRAEKARLVEAFQFDPRKKGRAYSKGNRQKVALIAAFAVPAELYILDEPTSGLDPLMELVFRREVARVRASGATVLLSSHILSEVEQLCDRVSIIRAGRVVESGTLAELRHLTRTEVSFDAGNAADAADGTDASGAADASADTAFAGLPDIHDAAVADGRARFTVDSDRVAGILPALASRNVRGLRIEPPSLEELFLRHYGDEIGDGAASAVEASAGSSHTAREGARR